MFQWIKNIIILISNYKFQILQQQKNWFHWFTSYTLIKLNFFGLFGWCSIEYIHFSIADKKNRLIQLISVSILTFRKIIVTQLTIWIDLTVLEITRKQKPTNSIIFWLRSEIVFYEILNSHALSSWSN